MEIEIFLESGEDGLAREQVERIDARIRQWHAEGAELRYDKKCFGSLTAMETGKRYRVDLAQVDPVRAIRELHAHLYRHGLRVFAHFLP